MVFGRKVLAVHRDSAFALAEILTHYSKQKWHTWSSPTPFYTIEHNILTLSTLDCIPKLTRGRESPHILCLVLF